MIRSTIPFFGGGASVKKWGKKLFVGEKTLPSQSLRFELFSESKINALAQIFVLVGSSQLRGNFRIW